MSFHEVSQELYDKSSVKLVEIRKKFFRLFPFWFAGALTAVVATIYAKIFSYAEVVSIYVYREIGYWYITVPPVFFFLSWFLVDKYAQHANGSGIPQLMTSIELIHKKNDNAVNYFLGFKIIIVKICSSILSVIGGGAIGREGPTLQISGSIFYLFSKYWKFSEIQNKSAFLLAGAASGLASAFNTPLGGIVYVVEELAKSHLNTFRTGVIHSVIVSGIIAQMIMGTYLYLGFPRIRDFNLIYLGHYILIALFSSLIVVAFSFLLRFIISSRVKLANKKSKAALALMAGLGFSCYAVFVSENTLGPGKDLLNNLLFKNETANIVDVFSRLIGSTLTYATGGSGGIFAPTLSLSGAMGSFINSIFDLNLDGISVLIGMSAGLSALTHSPLTSFILILEMTDRHKAIFPLMLASIIGHSVSKLVMKHSIYEYIFRRILKEFD